MGGLLLFFFLTPVLSFKGVWYTGQIGLLSLVFWSMGKGTHDGWRGFLSGRMGSCFATGFFCPVVFCFASHVYLASGWSEAYCGGLPGTGKRMVCSRLVRGGRTGTG